jgi:acetyl esterase/lipase
MLDDRSSERDHAGADGFRLWSARSNRYGWASYLANVDRGDPPEAAVPARAPDLAGLAPAWIGVGTLDLFHDEDVAYAERLSDAGVPCELRVVEGAYHGFDVIHAGTEVAKDFRRAWVEALRGALVEANATGG